jgi:PAS domain S-box-containing protein
MPQWMGYAAAVAASVVAALISWPLQTPTSGVPLYLAFSPAVFVAAVVGGTGPGMLATVLSALIANLLFIERGNHLQLATTAQAIRLGLFLATNFAISALAGRFRMKSAMVRQNEARLRKFIDEAPVAIAMFDTELRYLAASRRWLSTFQLVGQQVIGRSHYEVNPDLPERWKQVHRRCLAGAVERADEDLFERADGRRQWVRWEARPWYIHSPQSKVVSPESGVERSLVEDAGTAPGEVGGIVIFTEDITARVEATEALRQSEERFHTMADAMPQLAWMARADGYLFWFNRRCYEYTGATLEQLEGWGWQSVVDPKVLPKVLEKWRRSLATGEPYDMQSRLRGADGCFRPVLTRALPLKDKEGKVALWLATATDITELQEAKEALRQSEERFRTLIEQAPTPIGMSRNGIILYVNQKFLETFGSQNADDYIGRPITEHWAPESQAIIAERVPQRSLGSREPAIFEGEAQRKDGSRFPAHVASTTVDLPDGPASLAFITDITERKRLQERLEEAVEERTTKLHEALAELEYMSYSMVHDMRAPLRAMHSFAGLVQHECADSLPPSALDYLKRIRDASHRLDRLLTDALNYNKLVRESPTLGPIELGSMLQGLVQTYPNLQSPAADITIELTDLVVLGNESLLTQCFGNLLDNAVKFVAPGVHARVRIWAEAVHSPQSTVQIPASEAQRPEPAVLNSEIKNQKSKIKNPTVRIWVEDNGIGIPKGSQRNIFLMFQRMHHEKEYPGTGIGLAIVSKAVERMGGRISLDSEPGKGTRFCVELSQAGPQSQESLQSAA